MIEPDVAFRGNTVTMSSLVTQIDQTFAERLMATYKAAEFSGP